MPARIVAIDDDAALPMATVSVDDCLRRICLAYVPEAQTGDYVIVHSGFAIDRIDAGTAAAIHATFAQAKRCS